MRRFLFLMAALLLCFCGCKDNTPEESQKKLVMVTNATFPPYEYVEKGNIEGIDPEVVRRIATRLGYELEIQDMAFDAIIAAVQTGKAQIAASGITVTEDRKKKVFFTDSYVIAAQVMIVPQNSPIKGMADLKGKRIGVQHGTTGDMYVKENIQEPQRFQHGPDAVTALVNGKLDVVVIDGEPAEAYVSKNPSLKLLSQPLVQEEYAFAIGKSNKKLLDQFNAELRKMKKSGELAKIINTYRQPKLTVVIPAGSNAENRYTLAVLDKLAENLKFKVDIQEGSWESIQSSIQADRKQIATPVFELTEGQKKLIPHLKTFVVSEYVIVAPKESKIDISDLKNPKVVKTVPVIGNPDVPIVDGDSVLVPLGYQGLIKFCLAG